MATMTRRQRLMAIFAGTVPDRPAVKVWGAGTARDACVHPSFEAVRDRAVARTDLMRHAGSPFDIYCGRHRAERIESRSEPTPSAEWVHQITVYHTPQGDLTQVFQASTHGRPGYIREYLLKEPGDVQRLLSMPYDPFPFSAEEYHRVDGEVGEAGIAVFSLDHPMYALQRTMGSERFALWSLEHSDGLAEAVEVFSERLRQHARAAVQAGVRGVFGWVGPELCIPPLMPPAAFARYVHRVDEPLIADIHDAGGHVWVHCHGKMGPVIGRFAEMGVDVLNPIEPPPMGDLTVAEAFARVGDRLALEGGVETHDLMTAAPADLRRTLCAALEASRGHRFILCPSSGYQENVAPTRQEIANWLLYVDEGVDYAAGMAA
ncbi:MAG: uroporphyrinogen decarboxylase family protein [Candidatus Latescibacterota bacterium]